MGIYNVIYNNQDRLHSLNRPAIIKRQMVDGEICTGTKHTAKDESMKDTVNSWSHT